MKTAWSHLPNAEHIDRILADVKSRPEVWDMASDMASDAAWDAASDAAWDAAGDAVKDAVRDAVRDAAWDAALYAARDAVGNAALALIAWDHASSYLKLSPEQVLVIAHLGVNEAILMYPAVLALQNKTKTDTIETNIIEETKHAL